MASMRLKTVPKAERCKKSKILKGQGLNWALGQLVYKRFPMQIHNAIIHIKPNPTLDTDFPPPFEGERRKGFESNFLGKSTVEVCTIKKYTI